ncbi:MAG: RidA family protein, partial [Rhodothermales bacterium]|nr:RidA family protein [Rhodothermales bacterium]
MESISTAEAPPPAGHYSQAIVHNKLVFVSGQLPIVPGSSDRTVGTMAEQSRQVFSNLQAILDAAGSGLDHLLKVTIYISDMSDWGQVNEVYSEMLGSHKPARAIV